MRAILIDSEKQTLTEIDFEGGGDAINDLLGSECFTIGSRPLRGSMADGYDTIYVSDDYLEDHDDPPFWFQVDAENNPPSSYPLAGKGLVVGVDDQGGGCDAIISIDELAPRITFTRRKFRGFEITQDRGRGTLAGLPVTDLVRITLKAPIIDDE